MIVTVPALFPTVAEAVFTLTVMVPLLEPDAGVTVSQFTFFVAVHVPFEVTVMVWLAGFDPPCVAVYDKLDGVTVSEDAAATVNVTGTVTVVAPGALSVMVPL